MRSFWQGLGSSEAHAASSSSSSRLHGVATTRQLAKGAQAGDGAAGRRRRGTEASPAGSVGSSAPSWPAGGQICCGTLVVAGLLSRRRGLWHPERSSPSPGDSGALLGRGQILRRLLCRALAHPPAWPSWQLCSWAALQLSSHSWEEGRTWGREGQRCLSGLRAGQGPARPKGRLSDQESCPAVPCQGRDGSPYGAGRSS